MGGSSSVWVIILPCLMAIGLVQVEILQVDSASWVQVEKYLTCHVTLQNHVIDGSSNFISGSSSWYITTLASLEAIAMLVVKI